jgi:hypothetical protein
VQAGRVTVGKHIVLAAVDAPLGKLAEKALESVPQHCM